MNANCYVIPYGTKGIRPEVLKLLRSGSNDDLQRPGAPVVVIESLTGQMLCMHSLQHPFTLPPVAQDLAHAQTQVSYLCEHLCKLCGDWSKPQQQFILRYFEELRLLVSSNRETLQSKTKGLEGLIELDHWCFAAPMPLPRAHIYAPLEATDQSFNPEDFVLVDFAFWCETEIKVVQTGSGNSMRGSRKKEFARLEQSGVSVNYLDTHALDEHPSLKLLPAFGDEFVGFLDKINFPESPYRGRGIESPLAYIQHV